MAYTREQMKDFGYSAELIADLKRNPYSRRYDSSSLGLL